MILKDDLKRARPIFLVVGTDTGVGKTVFSGLLGKYLRGRGVGLRLIKPFCSGGRGDIDFLATCAAVSQGEVNYWYDDVPASPAAWELRTKKEVDFNAVVSKLSNYAKESDVLLVEGVGGLLAPLAERKTVADLGLILGSQLIIIAPNRVGVINHVLMTVEAAISRGLSVVSVVLMGQEVVDATAVDNAELIRMHIPNMHGFKGVFEFPWLGRGASNPDLIPINVKKADSVLEKIFDEVLKPYLINVLRN